MAFIVQKFGGSSVADKDRVYRVAGIIADTYCEGNDVVVVLSAQGKTTDQLIAKAKEVNADAILVSQTVTQKDIHIQQLTKMEELVEAEGLRDKVILTCGGPRISHELAQELGYDAGFGPGKYAEHVMSYIMQEVEKRGWQKKPEIADR